MLLSRFCNESHRAHSGRMSSWALRAHLLRQRIPKQIDCSFWTAHAIRTSASRPLEYQHRNIRFLSSTINNNDQKQQQRPALVIQGTIPSLCDRCWMDLRVGQYAELHRTYTQEDVDAFGAISGDYNPVHFRPTVCSKSNPDTHNNGSYSQQYDVDDKQLNPPPRSIVHGILLASIFSTIFGTLLPGCMYRSQSFKFHHPIFVDDEVYGRVVVMRLRHINNDGGGTGVLCKCDTTIHKKIDSSGTKRYDTLSDEKDGNILCVSGEAHVYSPRCGGWRR
jgi:3-hydroxybutyryl-CoA dehydratase